MNIKDNQTGFTLIELLVAMSLFAFVLLVATVGFLQVNRIYHRSNTVAAVQNTTRSVVDDLSRSVRLANPESPIEHVPRGAGDTGIICIGNVVYVYFINFESGTRYSFSSRNQEISGLVRVPSTKDTCAEHNEFFTTGFPNEGDNLGVLDSGFVLRDIQLNSINGTADRGFNISATVSFGADDLFETADRANTKCKGSVERGSQFCSVSSLQTAAFRRLGP